MEVILKPETNLRPRYWVLGAMLLPILFVPHLAWWLRIIACIVPVMLTGTYRISSINGDKFRSQLFISFLPMKPEKCNLPGVVYLETKYNSTGIFGEVMPILAPIRFIFMTIFDMLMPALGGSYEIWLITAKGREIVAWQGFDQRFFEENVALLQARSGAEVRGRTK
jgi:hypothetical protein